MNVVLNYIYLLFHFHINIDIAQWNILFFILFVFIVHNIYLGIISI